MNSVTADLLISARTHQNFTATPIDPGLTAAALRFKTVCKSDVMEVQAKQLEGPIEPSHRLIRPRVKDWIDHSIIWTSEVFAQSVFDDSAINDPPLEVNDYAAIVRNTGFAGYPTLKLAFK